MIRERLGMVFTKCSIYAPSRNKLCLIVSYNGFRIIGIEEDKEHHNEKSNERMRSRDDVDPNACWL